MFERLRKKGWALAVSALMVASVGFATPALGEGEPTYDPSKAMLTKVIVAPIDTDAKDDKYVFHFAGGGEVKDGDTSAGQNQDKIYSDGVEQDGATLKAGDVVPTIPDVTLKGVTLTSENSLNDGEKAQSVVQVSIDEILTDVVFPHAGVYTYVVTEKSATTLVGDGAYINASQANYTLRIRVENTNVGNASVLGDRELTVADVTVERTKDDNGGNKEELLGKVDPTYPKATDGKITSTAEGKSPGENELATADGLNVPGFTFGNEYIQGGSFVVKKLYDGKHSDRTKYSTVELAIYSEEAKSEKMQGSVLTYVIEGEGIDTSEGNQDDDGDHMKLNGVYDISQANHYMQKFNDNGWAFIKADLKEDSVIRITGMFGPYDPSYEAEAPNGKDKRMTISTSGLTNGQRYWVIERNPGDYRPTGYVYEGEGVADPRESADGMTTCNNVGDSPYNVTIIPGETTELPAFALCLEGTTTGSATTVFVVNTIDENKVSPTGILINNLPYILMVGGPLAIFAIMFVSKRRRNAAA